MQLKALAIALVLGSSSLALAAPGPGVTVRDHRATTVRPTVAPAPLQSSWRRPVFTQVRPLLVANDINVRGRTAIDVSVKRAFTKLELRAQKGQTKIDRVLIVFGNSRTQTIALGQKLKKSQTASIDLQGNARYIEKIVLIGNSGRRAALDVVAM